MSEQDEQRPLSRRERRLREMAETGALDLSEISEMVAEPKPVSQPKIDNEIEISPFHEDGTPRSRREMRELRERALAERAQAAPEAADGADVEASDPAESTTDAASETSEIDDVAAEDAPAEAAQAERASVEEVPVEPAGELIPEPVPAVRPAPPSRGRRLLRPTLQSHPRMMRLRLLGLMVTPLRLTPLSSWGTIPRRAIRPVRSTSIR